MILTVSARSMCVATVLVLSAAPTVHAQRVGSAEIDVQMALFAALDRVAPSTVTIETFGGRRKILTPDRVGPTDAPTAPKRPTSPKPNEEGEKDDERKGLGPLVAPGFLQAQGATTGIVLSTDGWIAISRFALNFDPTTILVTLPDGRSLHAERFGEDTSRGIALIKIDATGLTVPEFVPADAVDVGAWAFAVGRTFGREEPTVHAGIVSARERLFGRAVQIDAYTSPANYGGPVVDLRGRVIGMSTPLSPSGRDVGVDWYDSGIGFAASLHGIDTLIARMQAGEILHRGWLGVSTRTEGFDHGAVIAEIAEGSPAAAAGLQAGDVIVRIDGDEVRHPFHLQLLVSRRMAGDVIRVEALRVDAEGVSAEIALAAPPEKEIEARTKTDEAFTLPWEGDPPERDGDEGR